MYYIVKITKSYAQKLQFKNIEQKTQIGAILFDYKYWITLI